jgi:hypothetical protein
VPDEKQLVPAVRENLVALRDRREAVIAALTDHFAKDVLDVDEYDRRITLAHQARSLAELDDIVVDLAPVTTTAMATRREPLALDAYPEKKRWLCIMGGVDKKGRWTVPRHMRVVCFWGGAQLDLREADLAPGVTELRVTCVMGGCHIIVPPNLAIEIDGTAIMGGFDEMERGHGEPDPGRSLLRVTGLCVMGGFSVETRLPGETSRDARKRIKKERKQLVAGGSRQLASGSGNGETKPE